MWQEGSRWWWGISVKCVMLEGRRLVVVSTRELYLMCCVFDASHGKEEEFTCVLTS